MADGEKIVVTGGTGYVGRALVARLAARGSSVTVLSRGARLPPGLAELPGVRAAVWDPSGKDDWHTELAGARAVVHLAGSQAVGVRFTEETKREIMESRVQGTQALVAALERVSDRPRVLVSASGAGYYGGRREDHPPLDESAPPGDDFLARVCVEWEARARAAEQLGVRVVMTRSGAVMGRGDGPLSVMALPFKLFGGGPLGNGRHVFCWVHLEDAVSAIERALDDERVSGPINVTAPNAVTYGEAAQLIARALHRPSWIPAPSFALRAIFGEGADYLLTGQRAVPAKLSALGFSFRYPTLAEALAEALA